MPTLGRQSVRKQEVSAINTCPSCSQNVPDSIIRCSCGAYLFSNFNPFRTLLRMIRFPLHLVWRTLSWLAKARLKDIIIVYCLSVVFACIYVPWKVQVRAGQLSCDYSLIWSPPRCGRFGKPVVDYARVILEIVALTALGAIGLTLSGDIWKRGKKEIDLTQVMEKKK